MEVIKKRGDKIENMESFGSPLYRIFSMLGSRLLSQNSDLYAGISLKNPYSIEALKDFRGILDEFIRLLENDNFLGYKEKIDDLESVFRDVHEYAERSKSLLEQAKIKGEAFSKG